MPFTSGPLAGIKAVVFDAFGTLLRIGQRLNPYRRLLERLAADGYRPRPDDGARIMSAPLGLAGVPRLLGRELPPAELAALELDLYAELASIALYPDVPPALAALRQAGLKLALCSNLAAPYAVPVRLLLPDLDAYAFSFEVGAVKPQPAIYQRLAQDLACRPAQILMIGDTLEADVLGPRRQGLCALHLVRQADAGAPGDLRSLAELARLL